MKTLRQIALIAGIPIAVGLASACSRCETIDDETLIRSLIEKGIHHAEASQAKDVMRIATADFKLIPSNSNTHLTRIQLQQFFRITGPFSIVYPKPTIRIDSKTHAFAEAQIPLIIKKKGKSIPKLSHLLNDPDGFISAVDNIADVYTLELWLIKKSDEWRVRKARVR